MTARNNFFNPRILKYVFGALAVVAALIAQFGQNHGHRDAVVVKVYDGDTVRLADGEKVRLIGIDTPEEWDSAKLFNDARRTGQDIEVIKAQGVKAQKFTSDWVLGQKVRLEFDQEQRDKYGRLLAYIYMPFPHPPLSNLPRSGYIVNLDGKKWYFVNATIMQAGYAVPMAIRPNDKYREIFQALFDQAKDMKLGLWAENKPITPTHKRRSGGAAARAH